MTKFGTRAILMGAAGYMALSAAWSMEAQAQSTLPPVTVDEPRARSKPRTVSRPRVATARTAAPSAARPTVAAAPSISTNSRSTISTLPSYAGGQVARGGQLGLLGNRGFMDTPFNQISYTQKTIQDQQARTLGEILQNDPSVSPMATRYSSLNTTYYRGFAASPTYNTDLSMNGLFGLVPFYSPSLINIERVEVLKGPSALLNGMPVGGAVGGSVNLVTKMAGDEPLAQLTSSYVSRSIFGQHVDLGQRYGDNKEFGIRFNGSYAKGDTAISPQGFEQGVGTLNMDYRSERIRVSADLGYQADDISATMRFISIAGLTGVPTPPDSSKSLSPPWAFESSRSLYGMVRGEADIADNVTVYAAAGTQRFENYRLLANSAISNLNGNFSFEPFQQRTYVNPMSALAGIRSTVSTGPVEHEFNVNWSNVSNPGGDNFALSGVTVSSNLYNPVFGPSPYVPDPGRPIPNTYQIGLTSVGIADTMSILDKRIQLTVGVRRQHVEAENFNGQTGARTLGYDSSAWSPSYALVIKPIDNVSLYANYIQGLQQGTVVGNTFQNAGDVLPPYMTEQYETGVKVDWGRIATTLSLFQITQPSTITVPGTRLPVLTVDGEQTNKGIEFNVFGEVVEGVRLLGGATFIDGRLTRTQNGALDGARAQGAPAVRVVLGSEWDTPFLRGFTLNGRVTYTDEQYVSNTNRALLIPEWTRLDLGARYTFASPWNNKPVVVRFNVENVLGANYWVTGNNGFVALSQPRTYMLSSTFNF